MIDWLRQMRWRRQRKKYWTSEPAQVRREVLQAAQEFIKRYGADGAVEATDEASKNAADAGDDVANCFFVFVSRYLYMTEYRDPSVFSVIEPDGNPTPWELLAEEMRGGPGRPAAG